MIPDSCLFQRRSVHEDNFFGFMLKTESLEFGELVNFAAQEEVFIVSSRTVIDNGQRSEHSQHVIKSCECSLRSGVERFSVQCNKLINIMLLLG